MPGLNSMTNNDNDNYHRRLGRMGYENMNIQKLVHFLDQETLTVNFWQYMLNNIFLKK